MKIEFELDVEGFKKEISEDILSDVKGMVYEQVNEMVRAAIIEKLNQLEEEPYAIMYQRIERIVEKAMREVAEDLTS